MSELGQVLQRAREEKGISLEEIQRMTKIQVRYLEAIERGQFHLLPGHFYARAFIKSYAEAVGLDPNSLLVHYQSDLPAQPPQEQVERLRSRRAATGGTPIQAGRWVTQGLLILFIVLVVGVIYMALVNRSETQSPIPGNTLREQDQIQGTLPDGTAQTQQPSQNVTPPANTTASGTAGSTSVASTTPAGSAASANSATNPATSPTGANTGTSGATTPATTSAVTFVAQQGSVYKYEVTGGESLKINIKGTSGQCWLNVREKARGKSLGQAVINTGMEQSFDAAKTAYIVVGNPRAVEISINGTQIPMNDIKMIPAYLDVKIKDVQQQQ